MTAITTSSDKFPRIDYVKITVFGLALSALWGSMHSIVLPMRLLDFVAESVKNTYLGLLTLSGLLLAMLVQPVAGAISDRCTFTWGRRRIFLLAGTVAAVLLIPGIGLAGSYIAIFTAYCLIQVSTNIAQGPYQAFIPDLVPGNKRGLASGVKSLLEIAGGFALVYLIVYAGNFFATEGISWLWVVLGTMVALLIVTMLITVITVKESPLLTAPESSLLPVLYKSFKIELSKSPGFLLFLFSRLLFVMALTTLQSFAFYYLQDVVKVGNPATATAELLAAVGISMFVAVYPAGFLSDRLGRKAILVCCGVLGAMGIMTLFFAPAFGYVLVGGALIGTAGGAFLSSNWALATDLVPRSEEARYLGLTNIATAGGAALARLIGPAIDFFNRYEFGLGYQVMLLTCFVYFVLGSLLILKIKRRG